MSGFLSDRDVRRLTGLLEKGAQVAWLQDNGVHHWVSACGKPVVPWSAVEHPDARSSPAKGWAPDFTHLKA